MELYNKGIRSIIIPREAVISGGRDNGDTSANKKLYFDKDSTITVKDDFGKRLVAMYPKEIKQIGGEAPKKKRKAAKKAVKAEVS